MFVDIFAYQINVLLIFYINDSFEHKHSDCRGFAFRKQLVQQDEHNEDETKVKEK